MLGVMVELVSYIDHTVLRADCTRGDVQKLCKEALDYHFTAVCIPPYFVKDADQLLSEQAVKVATVIGFPMGYSATAAKVEEIKRALGEGADEIDVVANISAVKCGDWAYVKNDIDSMTRAVHLKGKVIKIIFETNLLALEEIKQLCTICKDIGVDFVKTSTGFQGDGITADVVHLLRSHLPNSIKLKASGGIRTLEMAKALIEAGADRLGSSAGIQ